MTTVESPSTDWLVLTPGRTHVPNGTFDGSIDGWTGDGNDPSGWTLADTVGETGSGTNPPQFDNPQQVAIGSDGTIYVADFSNNRLMILDSDGDFVNQIASLTNCVGVAVDASNNIYVSFNTNSLRKYNSGLSAQWTQTVGTELAHVATDGTSVFVGDLTGDTVHKRLTSNGNAGSPATIGTSGSGDGQLDGPHGVLLRGGELYVTEENNDRVSVFTASSGAFARKWGTLGSGNGQFTNPRGIAADASGDILVADTTNGRVQRFTNTGTLIDQFSQINPRGIAVTTDDLVWVSEHTNDTLALWIDASVTRAWDGTIGGENPGSFRYTITAGIVTISTFSDTWFRVNGRENVEVSGWVRTTSSNLRPRLRLEFADDAGTVISGAQEGAWTPAVLTEYTRVFAARVPERATQYRIGLLALTAAPVVGEQCWFDDIALNDTVLYVSDIAMGQLDVAVAIAGRWL